MTALEQNGHASTLHLTLLDGHASMLSVVSCDDDYDDDDESSA